MIMMTTMMAMVVDSNDDDSLGIYKGEGLNLFSERLVTSGFANWRKETS